MIIDKGNHVISTDNIMENITFDDIITAAGTDGENKRNARQIFREILKAYTEDAWSVFEKYEQELNKIISE